MNTSDQEQQQPCVSQAEKEEKLKTCSAYIEACRPFRQLPASMRVKHCAEQCLEFGYVTLLLYNRCAGVAVAKEMAMRLMQMIEVYEGRVQQQQIAFTSEDPYRNVIPRQFQDHVAWSVNDQLVWKAMFAVLGYLVDYNAAGRPQDTVEDGLNKLFTLNIDASMFACDCEREPLDLSTPARASN